jgi:hypothetical protein
VLWAGAIVHLAFCKVIHLLVLSSDERADGAQEVHSGERGCAWMEVECPLTYRRLYYFNDEYLSSDVFTITVTCMGSMCLLIPICTSLTSTLPLKGKQAPYQQHVCDASDVATLLLIHLWFVPDLSNF